MMDVIEITFNEFKEDIYAKYIRLFPEDEQRDWKKIERTYKDGRNRRAASEKMSTGHFLPAFRQALTCTKLGNFLFGFLHQNNKKDLKLCFKSNLVQMAGIVELRRENSPQDYFLILLFDSGLYVLV